MNSSRWEFIPVRKQQQSASRSRKLRAHIFKCNHKAEKANLKQGEAIASPNVPPARHFLHLCWTTQTALCSASRWTDRSNIPPDGGISHSNHHIGQPYLKITTSNSFLWKMEVLLNCCPQWIYSTWNRKGQRDWEKERKKSEERGERRDLI